MTQRILSWGFALVLILISGEAALAGARWPHCRPYTVETTCPKGHQLCYLKMVYAPAQSPGVDASGYWYGTPHPGVYQWRLHKHGHHHVHHAKSRHHQSARHHSPRHHGMKHHVHKHHARACGYRCWYKHWPQHGLAFGD